MKTKSVLAIQLPARCPLSCNFCRTPEHGEGNDDVVLTTINQLLANNNYDEVYLTSNGETGLSKIFKDVVALAQAKDISVSVLCATKHSIIPGLKRSEISFNKFTEESAIKAIEKAKGFGIPVIVSVVDEGGEELIPQQLMEQLSVDGVLIRALQSEGRSTQTAGQSNFFTKETNIGIFPVTAYKELSMFGDNAECVNHFGKIVPFLGAA